MWTKTGTLGITYIIFFFEFFGSSKKAFIIYEQYTLFNLYFLQANLVFLTASTSRPMYSPHPLLCFSQIKTRTFTSSTVLLFVQKSITSFLDRKIFINNPQVQGELEKFIQNLIPSQSPLIPAPPKESHPSLNPAHVAYRSLLSLMPTKGTSSYLKDEGGNKARRLTHEGDEERRGISKGRT